METNQNKPNEDINPITDENKHNPYTNQKITSVNMRMKILNP